MLRGVFVAMHVWALIVCDCCARMSKCIFFLLGFSTTILSFVMGTNVLRRLFRRLRNEA